MPRIRTLLTASLVTSGTCIAADTRSGESGRPRGVGPEFAKFYKDPERFPCVSLPSITIPFSAVNDDYCDCPDGSDEPGTAACSHLSDLSPDSPYNHPPSTEPQNITIPALPGFYCKNRGHVPAYLPFYSVNDGKCDYDYCCDGSDEWAGIGGVTCPDKCKDIGKEWRKRDEARKKSLMVAVKKRKELITQAATLKGEIQQKITTLEQEVKEHEAKVADLESQVAELEKKEKYKVVKSGGKSSRTTVLAGLAKQRVDELRVNLMVTREQRDAQKARVQQLEGVLRAFKEEYNPNFNDEGVKRAVRAWEDYAASDLQGDWKEVHDRDLDLVLLEDGVEHGVNWVEWESEPDGEGGDDDVAALYQLRNYLPATLRVYIAEKLASLRELLVENGVLAPAAPSDTSSVPESPALSSARSNLHTARSSLTNSERDLSSSQSDLEKDFGPSDVFRSLKDTCVTIEAGEYEYKHCIFSRLSQRPKKGGGETNMGNFEGYEMIPASDTDASLDPEDLSVPNVGPVAAAVTGAESPSERMVLKYTNGASCWNGPARSTRVILGCSEKEVIWRVRESEKCVYEVWAGTTAVCPENTSWGKKGTGGKKDEL